MTFERKPFIEDEEHLYKALPLEDRSMGFGYVGHVRAELIWHDFYHMWCPDRDGLATPAFRRELKTLLGRLRQGPFGSESGLRNFGPNALPMKFFGDFGIYVKFQSECYSYFIRCRPMERGHDITIRAYDNSFLLPELAGKHELPEKCFSVIPESGELVMLQQERPYVFPFHSDDPPEIRRQVADEMNEAMGVTKAQEKAMLGGSLHGFSDPRAWPWQYDKNGEPRNYVKHQKDKEAR